MVDAGILRAGFVLGTFMLLDLSKYWIGQLFGTHAVWSLTQDVRALRHQYRRSRRGATLCLMGAGWRRLAVALGWVL